MSQKMQGALIGIYAMAIMWLLADFAPRLPTWGIFLYSAVFGISIAVLSRLLEKIGKPKDTP
jgi:hypothetical protein